MSIVEGLLIQSLSLLSGLTSRTFSRPYQRSRTLSVPVFVF